MKQRDNLIQNFYFKLNNYAYVNIFITDNFNGQLYDHYCSQNIIRVTKSTKMRLAGHVARMVKRSGAYRGLVGRHEGKSPLGSIWRRWEESIKVDLQGVVREVMDRIDLAQDRDRCRALVNAVMNLRVECWGKGAFFTG